jgi:hypothetical protein
MKSETSIEASVAILVLVNAVAYRANLPTYSNIAAPAYLLWDIVDRLVGR